MRLASAAPTDPGPTPWARPRFLISACEPLIAGTRKQGLAKGYGISLGDALCIAVAERMVLPLLGGDKLWDKVAMNVQHRRFRK